MRPLYDEFDEFDFADSSAVRRLLREQRRERRRHASRKPYSTEEEDFLEDLDSFDDYADMTLDH